MGFLSHNKRFRILASQSMLHYAKSGQVKEYIPTYDLAPSTDGLNDGKGHFPSSTYLEVVS